MMIRSLVRRTLRGISFNFFKRKKSPQQEEIQKNFESFKKNEGPIKVKSKFSKVNQQLLNEAITEIENFNATAQYIPKERSAIANSIIKKIISCRGFQPIMHTRQDGRMILEKFVRTVWEDIDTFDTAEPIVNMFWLAVNANFFFKEVSYNDYLMFFNLNADRLEAREIVTVLNVFLIRHRMLKSRGDDQNQNEHVDLGSDSVQISYEDLTKDEKDAIEQLARSCLTNLQQSVEDFYSLSEISTLMRKIGYVDKEFFEETERLIKLYLLPFNSQRMIAYLTYFAAKGRDLKSSEEKQKIFQESADFLVENLKFCSFHDLYLFTMLYIKEIDVANEVSAKVLIERILNMILERDELMLETQKLLDMLELAKGKVSVKYLLQGLRKAEAHMMRELKLVTASQFAQFVFLCHDVGYAFVYQEDFDKKMISLLYSYELDDLRKVCWANEYIFRNENFYSKVVSILEQKIDAIVKDDTRYINPEKVIPFIWILNMRLTKETVAKFEEYIQKYINRFSLHDIGIVMWSVVQKTKMTRKTIFMILDRYQTLLTELYSNEFDSQNSNKTDLTFASLGTWEVMTILWGFNSFQFDQEGELMAKLIDMSIPMVQNLLDEFTKVEFVMITRVFMADRPFFSQIYSEQKDFYDALINRLEEYMDEFDLQQTTVVSYVLAGNSVISKDYESLLVKLVERRNLLKFEQALSSTIVDNSQQSDIELEKRFSEHI